MLYVRGINVFLHHLAGLKQMVSHETDQWDFIIEGCIRTTESPVQAFQVKFGVKVGALTP